MTARYLQNEKFIANVESVQKDKTLVVNRDDKAAAVFSIFIERNSKARKRGFCFIRAI